MIKRQVVSCLGWLIAAVFFGLYRENTSFIRNLRTSESIPQSQCTKGKVQTSGFYWKSSTQPLFSDSILPRNESFIRRAKSSIKNFNLFRGIEGSNADCRRSTKCREYWASTHTLGWSFIATISVAWQTFWFLGRSRNYHHHHSGKKAERFLRGRMRVKTYVLHENCRIPYE